MGQDYFYFVSTLPMLHLGAKPHITMEEFMGGCDRHLTGEDLNFIRLLLEDPGAENPTDDALLEKILKFAQSYQNVLAVVRAQRAGADPNDFVKGERYDDPFIAEVASRASKEPNLLESEIALDEVKWKHLNDLVMGHHFDTAYLCVYGLKLKILERQAEVIHSPAGKKIFDKYEMFELTGEQFLTLPEHRST